MVIELAPNLGPLGAFVRHSSVLCRSSPAHMPGWWRAHPGRSCFLARPIRDRRSSRAHVLTELQRVGELVAEVSFSSISSIRRIQFSKGNRRRPLWRSSVLRRRVGTPPVRPFTALEANGLLHTRMSVKAAVCCVAYVDCGRSTGDDVARFRHFRNKLARLKAEMTDHSWRAIRVALRKPTGSRWAAFDPSQVPSAIQGAESPPMRLDEARSRTEAGTISNYLRS